MTCAKKQVANFPGLKRALLEAILGRAGRPHRHEQPGAECEGSAAGTAGRPDETRHLYENLRGELHEATPRAGVSLLPGHIRAVGS